MSLGYIQCLVCNVPFQKISILLPQKGLEFPGGWGFCKTKIFKEMYEPFKIGISRGVRVLEEIPSVGEVWIFSVTTH